MKLSGIRGIVRFLLHQLDFCHARVYDIVHWSKSHCTCTCILHRVQMAIHICATMVYCHANCYSLISAWNHLVYVYLSLEEWELFSCIRSLCQWLHPWDWTPPPFLKLGFPCGTLCTFLSEIEFEANVKWKPLLSQMAKIYLADRASAQYVYHMSYTWLFIYMAIQNFINYRKLITHLLWPVYPSACLNTQIVLFVE